jgi:UDP-N-acetylmuramoylalanine--D-glutamate ligase
MLIVRTAATERSMPSAQFKENGLEAFADRRILVVGLGRFGGGVGVTRWLAGQGARVVVTDLATEEQLKGSLKEISDLNVELRLGRHDEGDLAGVDLVIVNPAVPKARSVFFRRIVERGVPWTTEMNLFCERCPSPVVGVTGTYGKSTTCAMLADAARACLERDCAPFTRIHLGGNIGRSLLSRLHEIRPSDLVILEMSNAQLEDLPRIGWAPHLAVITNLFPNHLDRHGSWEAYLQAKLNIARDPTESSLLVLGPLLRDVEKMVNAVLPLDSRRIVRVLPPDPPVALSVPGAHNRNNADCVLTTARVLGLDDSATLEALRTFAGLPHRLQQVRTLDGVEYVNDSKSTSPAATATALGSVRGRVIAIVGGQDKGVSLQDCGEALAERCRAVICIGESGPRFARAVREASAGRRGLEVREAQALPQAVEMARSAAEPGDVVLFAPGGPSFDAYANFEERGRHFIELVKAL